MVLIDHQHYQSWSMMVMSKNFYGDQSGLSVRLREPPKKPSPPRAIQFLRSLPTLKPTFNIANIAYNVLVKTRVGFW